MKFNRLFLALLVANFTFLYVHGQTNLSQQVTITRTEYGVPHIQAQNMMAAGMGLGYVQIEDYGQFVVDEMIKAEGKYAEMQEISNPKELNLQIDADAAQKLKYQRAVDTYPLLNQDTRDFLEGYADGMNLYISKNPKKFADWVKPNFTGVDIHARSIDTHKEGPVKTFLRRMAKEDNSLSVREDTNRGGRDGRISVREDSPMAEQATNRGCGENNVFATIALNYVEPNPETGSNTWALAPNRINDGHAVLLRNPHLDWVAGYYEAHISVPGKFDFYGDFRAGDPLGTVGGFNQYLGFSTTNNDPKMGEIYALKRVKKDPNAYVLDRKNHHIISKEITVAYKQNGQLQNAKRTLEFTEYGPIIHKDNQYIYIIKSSREGEYRIYEQFLELMKSKSLVEWKQAMRINAKSNSNLMYADRDGNIFYVWNAKTPILPVPSGDGNAVKVTSSKQIWSKLFPWDSLPHLLNPIGGYLHNENDPFHFTNLNEIISAKDFPPYFSQPRLGLRSQMALSLIDGNDKMSLEDVVIRKHDLHIMLAERVKPDLIKALNNASLSSEEKDAVQLLTQWDNTVSMDSRGSILFTTWWDKYVSLVNGGRYVPGTPESVGFNAKADQLFRQVWDINQPATTPVGLANFDKAVDAFHWAINECNNKYGTWNLPWGEVHRAIIGDQNLPVGGVTGQLGAFRVLWFEDIKGEAPLQQVTGGDGWILAVEFEKDEPKAYSILAYGNSILKDSPYYGNQLNLFTHKKLKPVFYNWKEVAKNAVVTYHPGEDIQ